MKKRSKKLLIIGVLCFILLGLLWAIRDYAAKRSYSYWVACIGNLRHLEAAKDQYQLEMNATNGTILANSDLDAFIRIGVTNVRCSAGGEYTIGPIGVEPTCSVHGNLRGTKKQLEMLKRLQAPLDARGIRYSAFVLDEHGECTVQIEDPDFADLSILARVPLKELSIAGSKVTNLSPLKGSRLKKLGISKTSISDIQPLAGLPIHTLHACNTQITNLTALAKLPLDSLHLHNANVTDLSPLAKTPLTWLCVAENPIKDLSPLKNLKLKSLIITETDVTDLSSLKSVPLKHLRFTPNNITGGIDVVRGIVSLKEINDMPAEKFWKKYDAGELHGKTEQERR